MTRTLIGPDAVPFMFLFFSATAIAAELPAVHDLAPVGMPTPRGPGAGQPSSRPPLI